MASMSDIAIPQPSSSTEAETLRGPSQHSSGPDASTQTSQAKSLNPAQLHALFDILTHYQTYAEVESFKHPGTIAKYGRPFEFDSVPDSAERQYAPESSAPLMASFLTTVVLPIPGVKNLPADFWSQRLQGILVKLAEVELSESYDKGAVGARKTLATAASVIQETVTRGQWGGFPWTSRKDLSTPYDLTKAEDQAKAWDDAVHELVYGDLIDELFDCAIEHDSIEQHSAAVKAASEYVIIQ